ncbi:MAG: TetR/AcrR family transcriptional regulator [Acidimicrobiales bacterium]
MPPSSRADTPSSRPETGKRQHILSVALALMSQHGVDGTSMRELASATGLNVATLYHYFPSKRDLLVAVLEDQGFIDTLTTASPEAASAEGVEVGTAEGSGRPGAATALAPDPATGLSDLIADMLISMLQVEDFVRLMLGEVLRGDETAISVGTDLFAATQQSVERWLTETRPDLCEPEHRTSLARVLRAIVVGFFFEHVAEVLVNDGDDPVEALRMLASSSAVFFERTDAAEDRAL